MSLVLNYSSDSEASTDGENTKPSIPVKRKPESLTAEEKIGKQKVIIKVEVPAHLKFALSQKDERSASEKSVINHTAKNGSSFLSEQLASLLPKPKNSKQSILILPRSLPRFKQRLATSLKNTELTKHENTENVLEVSTSDDEAKKKNSSYFFPVESRQTETRVEAEAAAEQEQIPEYYQADYEGYPAYTEQYNYNTASFSTEPSSVEPGLGNYSSQDINEDILKYMPKSERNLLNSSKLKQFRQSDHLDDSHIAVQAGAKSFVAIDHKLSSDFASSSAEPSKMQKRKHNIMYLAFDAKQKELKLKETYSQNARTQRETRSKYGF